MQTTTAPVADHARYVPQRRNVGQVGRTQTPETKTNPLATPETIAELAVVLSDLDNLALNASGSLPETIQAMPAGMDVSVEILSVERVEGCGHHIMDVVAMIAGKRVRALAYAQDGGDHQVFDAALESDALVRPWLLDKANHESSLRDAGKHVAAHIVGLTQFEYGGGVVRLGDGPLRRINGFNCGYDASTGLMHLNDVVIDFGRSVVSVAPCDAAVVDDQYGLDFMVDGVPLKFALSTWFPDGELTRAVNFVDPALERMKSGLSKGLRVVVDGAETFVEAKDVVVARQPRVMDVIDQDRGSLSAPVREFLDETMKTIDRDVKSGMDRDAAIRLIDMDAGSVIHVDLGGAYSFDRDGSEGLLDVCDDSLECSQMDLQGRMVTIEEIAVAA